MRKPKVTIKPATLGYAKEFYGEQFAKSFKGYAALLGGKVVGIGGIHFDDEMMVLFSDIKKEFRPFKRDIVRGVRMLGEMLKKTRCPVIALADKNEPAAEKLLTKLGFSPSGFLSPDGCKIFRRYP